MKGQALRKTEGKFMTIIPVDYLEAKIFGLDSIKLQSVNTDIFRLSQKHLTELNTDFNTFSLPEEKPSKYL